MTDIAKVRIGFALFPDADLLDVTGAAEVFAAMAASVEVLYVAADLSLLGLLQLCSRARQAFVWTLEYCDLVRQGEPFEDQAARQRPPLVQAEYAAT